MNFELKICIQHFEIGFIDLVEQILIAIYKHGSSANDKCLAKLYCLKTQPQNNT